MPCQPPCRLAFFFCKNDIHIIHNNLHFINFQVRRQAVDIIKRTHCRKEECGYLGSKWEWMLHVRSRRQNIWSPPLTDEWTSTGSGQYRLGIPGYVAITNTQFANCELEAKPAWVPFRAVSAHAGPLDGNASVITMGEKLSRNFLSSD